MVQACQHLHPAVELSATQRARIFRGQQPYGPRYLVLLLGWCLTAERALTTLLQSSNVQDYPNPTAISLNSAGLAWTLGRLQEACKLNLRLIWCSNELYLDSSVVKASLQACEGLRSLKTLVRSTVLQP